MIKQLYSIFFCCVISFTVHGIAAGEIPEDVLTEARELHKKADNLQGAWLTTEKLIKQADKALNNKKIIALQLANKARKEARLSYSQAKDQLQNWSEPSYIKK